MPTRPRRHNRNYYKRWTKIEDGFLVVQRRAGKQWSEIALSLDRTSLACLSRFRKLEANEEKRKLEKLQEKRKDSQE